MHTFFGHLARRIHHALRLTSTRALSIALPLMLADMGPSCDKGDDDDSKGDKAALVQPAPADLD